MGKEQHVRDMWEYFCQERARVKRFRQEAEEKGKQEYRVSGSWNQDFCGNLIYALNQQEDGDGFIQNIVTNLCEGRTEGLTNGLRELIKIDNHGALEVGHLNEGLGNF